MRLTTVKVFIEVEAEVSVWQLSGSEVEIGPVVLKSKDGFIKSHIGNVVDRNLIKNLVAKELKINHSQGV
tara:strand:- start:2200 stop:2409 length:210 start_codon:yes stop_codon:yes gene_type:complete